MTRATFRYLAVAGALLAFGCEERARPWSAPPDSSVRDETQPFLPDAGPLFGGGGGSDGDESPASRAGGQWVGCYARFEPRGPAIRSVTQLGMLCGPPNGMRRIGDTLEGAVEAGGSHTIKARAGACYRIFAVADESVTDLDVTVRSSRDSRIATDNSDDRWPIVEPERPFCSFADDTFTIALTAEAGKGRYAAEIWELPP